MTASGKLPLLLCVCLSQSALTASRARRDHADPLGPRWGSKGRGRAVYDIPGLLVQCSCSPCCLGHAYPEVWLSRETLSSDVLLLLPQQHSQPCTGRKVGSKCCAIPALLLSSPGSSLTVWLLPSFLTLLPHHRLWSHPQLRGFRLWPLIVSVQPGSQGAIVIGLYMPPTYLEGSSKAGAHDGRQWLTCDGAQLGM